MDECPPPSLQAENGLWFSGYSWASYYKVKTISPESASVCFSVEIFCQLKVLSGGNYCTNRSGKWNPGCTARIIACLSRSGNIHNMFIIMVCEKHTGLRDKKHELNLVFTLLVGWHWVELVSISHLIWLDFCHYELVYSLEFYMNEIIKYANYKI